MMKTEKEYFELPMEQLQALGAWAADCAERSLAIFRNMENNDNGPARQLDSGLITGH